MAEIQGWPTLTDAEDEALQQKSACYCSAQVPERRPCGACRAERMIMALVKQIRRIRHGEFKRW
jgi:hypothetical protein